MLYCVIHEPKPVTREQFRPGVFLFQPSSLECCTYIYIKNGYFSVNICNIFFFRFCLYIQRIITEFVIPEQKTMYGDNVSPDWSNSIVKKVIGNN